MAIVIIVMLFAIVGSLAHALSLMYSGPERSLRMAKALTARISLSVALFGLLLVGYHFGWIQPHGAN
jgi:hypothetical protein